MSGSLLGRGRGGRLAVYAGCVAVVILLFFAYRAAVSEMARLRDLHEQCTIHQESLQQRLQVIFDYKVRLEKSLADETSANAAVKQELQQRATREKSRRDKDSVEAMQRYNSLQQAHKILETERKDLQEECDKRQKQALADTTRLETTLQGLRAELKQARDDKVQSLEHLKSKYLQIDTDKTKLEEKYNELVKSNADVNMQNQRLQKEVFQLNRELEYVKKPSENGVNHIIPSLSSPSVSLGLQSDLKNTQRSSDGKEGENGAGQEGAAAAGGGGGGGPGSQNSINLARPPPDQQVSPASKNEAENPPKPIQAPRDHLPIVTGPKNDDTLPNEAISDVGFEINGGGMVVPVGPPRHVVEDNQGDVNLNVLPMPYDFKRKEDEKNEEKNREIGGKGDDKKGGDTSEKIPSENVGDSPRDMAPQVVGPNSANVDRNVEINGGNVLAAPFQAEKSSSVGPPLGKDGDKAEDGFRGPDDPGKIPIVRLQDEMQVLQEKLEGLDDVPVN